MSIMRSLVCTLLFLSLGGGNLFAQDDGCSIVAGFTAEQLLDFLQHNSRTADPQCVTEAITRAGVLRTPAATEVLITLLDFERPETAMEKMHISSLHDKFPAVPALFAVGKPAVPALIRRIQTGELTDVAQRNSLRALLAIYRESPPEAILTLKTAAAKANNQADAVRLESSMRRAVGFCAKSWRERCNAVIADANR